MFSSKHKNTAFFSPLNQFSNVCQMALKAIPGLNKAFKNFLTETLVYRDNFDRSYMWDKKQ